MYFDQCRVWAEEPPVDLLVAAYLGVGKAKTKKRGTPEELLARLGITPPKNSDTAGDGDGRQQ